MSNNQIVVATKCNFKKHCVKNGNTQPKQCWAFTLSDPKQHCDKFVHLECYANWVKSEEKPYPTDGITILCGKRCLQRWRKDQMEKLKPKKIQTWEADGSMDVLLDWLTTDDNYAKYCGSSQNKGTSKAQFHKEIAEIINDKTKLQKTLKLFANTFAH